MKNAVRLSAIAQQSIHCPEQAHVSARHPIAPAAVNAAKPPLVRDDLGLRLLTPLPTNKRVVPHLTCQQAWRAWFLTTDSLPFPLRYAEGRLTLGSDVTALSRIKTVMNTLSLGIKPGDILEHSEATSQCAFAHLQTQLFQIDEKILIYSYNTCGTIEKKLRDAKARGWRAANTMFRLGGVVTRPCVYDAVEAHHRHNVQRESQLRATKQFQCDRCASLCMHCMHCDMCVKRVDAALACDPTPGDCDSASSASAAAAAAAPEMSKSKRVRCLRCKKTYCDKAGYNRHLRTETFCANKPKRFEYEYALRASARA